MKCLGVALAKVRGRGLDWGWIKVFIQVILVKSCWFAGVKCYMDVGGFKIGVGGGWRRDARSLH